MSNMDFEGTARNLGFPPDQLEGLINALSGSDRRSTFVLTNDPSFNNHARRNGPASPRPHQNRPTDQSAQSGGLAGVVEDFFEGIADYVTDPYRFTNQPNMSFLRSWYFIVSMLMILAGIRVAFVLFFQTIISASFFFLVLMALVGYLLGSRMGHSSSGGACNHHSDVMNGIHGLLHALDDRTRDQTAELSRQIDIVKALVRDLGQQGKEDQAKWQRMRDRLEEQFQKTNGYIEAQKAERALGPKAKRQATCESAPEEDDDVANDDLAPET